MSAGALTAGAAYLKMKQEEVASAEAASTADRIRGNYENKIRFFSPPEKIFETFASKKLEEDGTVVMTYGDFFKALTPYNYGEIKSSEDLEKYIEGFKTRVNKVLHYADADGDGIISFTEFFFFVTVLQLPETIIEKDFKKVDKMDEATFSRCMTTHRKKTKFGSKLQENSQLAVLESRNVKAKEDDFLKTNKDITKKIFNGKESITLQDYLTLRAELQESLWHYEFYQYEVDEASTISAEDFCRSLLIFMPFSKYN